MVRQLNGPNVHIQGLSQGGIVGIKGIYFIAVKSLRLLANHPGMQFLQFAILRMHVKVGIEFHHPGAIGARHLEVRSLANDFPQLKVCG